MVATRQPSKDCVPLPFVCQPAYGKASARQADYAVFFSPAFSFISF
jgi:hypothetical protein